MGASNSKVEEDKALGLCHERKKFVRQALDGRCSLATAHVSYIQSLKSTGTFLRRFVEPEVPIASSMNTSTPEPVGFAEKSHSHLSLSSPALSHHVDATENFSPSPSPPTSTWFHTNHMKFRGFYSKKVEEQPPAAVTETVTSLSIPRDTTFHSDSRPETPSYEASSGPAEPPWDYFELLHPIDHHLSAHDGKEKYGGIETTDDFRQLREEEGIPELEDKEGKTESDDSDEEFDDPPTDTLVRSFENLNRLQDRVAPNDSPLTPSADGITEKTALVNGDKGNSPILSPLRTPLSAVATSVDTKNSTPTVNQTGNRVVPKDFVSSIKEIEYLFIKGSDSGKEVPRMLEANKLHFRPMTPGQENGSIASMFLKACFSCGEDPSQVQEEETAENGVKYLTWHRTTSSRSSSSRNLLGLNGKDESDDLAGNPLESSCMISGSHASTLDRLYAWERKLYDEVKASEMVRKEYDRKCKDLRQLESKAESAAKIDKTRAAVKDLHSRIRVAILRIDSISKRIEELRDNELQPQLEELIEGLSRMWEVMFECHRLQLQIISIADNSGNSKMMMQSESRRQIIIQLENELTVLSSSFVKWIGSQTSYLQAINSWLFKCVFIPQKTSKRKRRLPTPSTTLRHFGPPIYATVGVWLDKLELLPVKDVAESIKGLVAETARFLPRQEKNQGKNTSAPSWNAENGGDLAITSLTDEDFASGSESFRSSLEKFLCQLINFAESSVKMYADVQKAIRDAKNTLEPYKSQVQTTGQ